MKYGSQLVVFAAAIAPAIALAPPVCYKNNWTCNAACGSAGGVTSCRQSPVSVPNGGDFTINSWQLIDQMCVTFLVTSTYDCDELLDEGWAPIGCSGSSECCQGDITTRTITFGPNQIWVPDGIGGCLQPGGEG